MHAKHGVAPGVAPRHDLRQLLHFSLYTATELHSIKACITSLASGISTGDLEFYFETICGDEVEVSNPLILGGGKAEVVLKGLTTEGMDKLETV